MVDVTKLLKYTAMTCISGVLGLIIYDVHLYIEYKKTENKLIQRNYIPPSKVEIKTKDVNGDGNLESIIKVNDKEYLLKYDNNKNPIISPIK